MSVLQFESNFGDSSREKKRMLDILKKVHSDKPTIDMDKAVNQHLEKEQRSR